MVNLLEQNMIWMNRKSFSTVLLAFLVVVTRRVSAVDLQWDLSVKIIPPSYYNVFAANVLRCGNLCERQGKCAAVTFDIRERKCYMHDTPVNANQTVNGSSGPYLIKNYPGGSKPGALENTCDRDTQISVPKMHHKNGGCYDIIEKNECDASPCQNNATCVDKKNDYYCNCLVGYTGKNCSVEINECDSAPCQNNGTCEDKINGYFCNCTAKYTGVNCSDTLCPQTKGYKLWTYSDMNLCIRCSLTTVNNQHDAKTKCDADGGHLVLIENDSMRLHLVNIITTLMIPNHKYMYIDGRDIDGTDVFIDWKGDETWTSWAMFNTRRSNEDCLDSNLNSAFRHFDVGCTGIREYLLCQIDV